MLVRYFLKNVNFLTPPYNIIILYLFCDTLKVFDFLSFYALFCSIHYRRAVIK